MQITTMLQVEICIFSSVTLEEEKAMFFFGTLFFVLFLFYLQEPALKRLITWVEID